MSVIFDRAAGKLCRSCALRDRCWKQDYASTFNAMNDATAPMMARGSALAEDFPRYFADRCLHFPAYVAAVDRSWPPCCTGGSITPGWGRAGAPCAASMPSCLSCSTPPPRS